MKMVSTAWKLSITEKWCTEQKCSSREIAGTKVTNLKPVLGEDDGFRDIIIIIIIITTTTTTSMIFNDTYQIIRLMVRF
jgi:hypothetical protein